MRRARVCGCLAETIHWIQSRRAFDVTTSFQNACAFAADESAFRKSAGIAIGSSFSEGSISNRTRSPSFAPAFSRSFRGTLSQCPFCPSGSSTAWNTTSLMVPSIVIMPREGSFAVATFGSSRKLQELSLSLSAGRRSLALNLILAARLMLSSLVFLIGTLLARIESAGRYHARSRSGSASAPPSSNRLKGPERSQWEGSQSRNILLTLNSLVAPGGLCGGPHRVSPRPVRCDTHQRHFA